MGVSVFDDLSGLALGAVHESGKRIEISGLHLTITMQEYIACIDVDKAAVLPTLVSSKLLCTFSVSTIRSGIRNTVFNQDIFMCPN